MNTKEILNQIVALYIEAAKDDEKKINRITSLFDRINPSDPDWLEDVFMTTNRAGWYLGDRNLAVQVYRAVRELLEKHYDKTYLGVLSVNEKPTHADRGKAMSDLIFPAVTANMKAQGIKTQTINKKLREFRIDDWFFDLANFLTMNMLMKPSYFKSGHHLQNALNDQIGSYYIGLLPKGLTLAFFDELQDLAVTKVINKNPK